MKDRNVLKINREDNVAVALQDLRSGENINIYEEVFLVREDVRAKHKLALQDFEVNENIVMYGLPIGKATTPIKKGFALSTNNIQHFSKEYGLDNVGSIQWEKPDVSKFSPQEFLGYCRDDNRVGTANYWVVVPLVFCENRNIQVMKEAMQEGLGYQQGNSYKQQVRSLISTLKFKKEHSASHNEESYTESSPFFENIDGVKFLSHNIGCGGTPDDARSLCGLIAGYINNPNVAGATVLSLGCQDAQVEILQEEIKKRNAIFNKPLFILEQQKYGTEEKMLTEAIKLTFEGLVEVNKINRKSVPLSKLVVGVECGGSDGFSGLSSNPAIGHTSDIIVALGGAVILSEFPELCGVEQRLIERCKDVSLATRFIDLQKSYARKAEEFGGGFYLNPSAGNINDGLLTDAMKSAGAVRKGGTSPITGVYDYPEMALSLGLSLLRTPGNDVESTTGLAGAGANLILFSTGLGTPTGNPIAPVIKISSNTAVFNKMHDIIDIDAGKIISGEETIESIGERILEFCIEVASGKRKPKACQLGQDDFIPWKRGVSL